MASPGQRIVDIVKPPSILAWISANLLSISLVKVTEMFCEKLTRSLIFRSFH